MEKNSGANTIDTPTAAPPLSEADEARYRRLVASALTSTDAAWVVGCGQLATIAAALLAEIDRLRAEMSDARGRIDDLHDAGGEDFTHFEAGAATVEAIARACSDDARKLRAAAGISMAAGIAADTLDDMADRLRAGEWRGKR